MQYKKAPINQDLQFLQETQDLSPAFCQDNCTPEENVYRLPFEFTVPENLISPRSDVAPEYLSLLPTVEEGSLYVEPTTGHKFMQPLVLYSLTASLSHTRSGKSYQVSQKISIMPTVSASPPLQIENFPHEYQMTCSKTLRKRLWTGAIGKLTVSAAEPPSLDISTHSPRATTTASVKLLFTPTKATAPITPPYDWSVTVRYFLQIMTFTTTRPFTQVPTQDRAKKNSLCNLASKTTLPEMRECETLSWRVHRISSTGTIIPDVPMNPWTSTLLVPVNTSRALLPTFLSPLAALRYALVLQISIADLCHGRLCLRIPIQITNEPRQLLVTPTRNSNGQGLEYSIDHIGDGVTSVKLEDIGTPNSEALTKPPPYEQGQYVRRA